MSTAPLNLTQPLDPFASRHLGPDEADVTTMLKVVGASSLEGLIAQTVPAAIRTQQPLDLGKPRGEHELLSELHAIAKKNVVAKSYLGMGYHDTITPPVIQRNILENPGWYTQYTPYQAEISQGRLEAMLNFQTLVSDLTGLPVSNASMLDEGTAAAEAMHLCKGGAAAGRSTFFVASDCHPQTIAVVQTRAEALGLTVAVGDPSTADLANCFGMLLQYPGTDGRVVDYRALIKQVHAAGAMVVMATDLLALTLLASPGELGADVAVGSAQRFGVPMGFGGPHAAFFATSDKYKRVIPGRLVGVSKDVHGKPALRLAMQTREQHIRREKATSNICTAQVLLANMASMYAVYHGPKGLKRIAERVHGLAQVVAQAAQKLGLKVAHDTFFDTVRLDVTDADSLVNAAAAQNINLRKLSKTALGIALDETTTLADIRALTQILGSGKSVDVDGLANNIHVDFGNLARTSPYLEHPVFNVHHSETEMLRYMHRLELKDLALNTAMIPLGSCTMKLNATSEMMPVTWPEFGKLHPFAPASQTAGYRELFGQLEKMIAQITGFAAVSLQPNAGSQGEYAGLLAIRRYHEGRGQKDRTICLIPQSAHGTNPASAVLAGMQVVVVACDAQGNVDLVDLKKKAQEHESKLSCLMITYPSTHGVYEESIQDICAAVHACGGQVYMDGANLNAQVGLVKPGEIGADVCHLNLHKTFAIPHGGGGPGMGPIAVAKHLAPYLPGHPVVATGGEHSLGTISAAPHGSASILTISWMYMMLMGGEGLTRATQIAILSANYMQKRLEPHYPTVYKGTKGRVAHEFILDLRQFKQYGIEAEDVAKRLMDYGFHAPTMSFPVAGTLMIEPTESEPLFELDRFCDAMIAIRAEIQAVVDKEMSPTDNPLKHAPHTAEAVMADAWGHAYSREVAAFPSAAVKESKYWPTVGRVDNAYGDRNLVCTCPPIESYT